MAELISNGQRGKMLVENGYIYEKKWSDGTQVGKPSILVKIMLNFKLINLSPVQYCTVY